jgi:H+-translocating NAD(P) transhydrogenase subunit beta
MQLSLLTICYLIGSVTFILGLKMLSHPDTARRGNLIAAFGMTIAIIGTIFLFEYKIGETTDGEPVTKHLGNYAWIFGAIILGTIVGTIIAKKVKMTAMPEMVSLFNGMGGLCAALISVMEFQHIMENAGTQVSTLHILIILIAMVIGSVSFAGSMIAYGKLNGSIKDYTFKGQTYINLALLIGMLAYVAWFAYSAPGDGAFTDSQNYLFYGIIAVALIYGVMFVMPIGGADMPVVISLLNSFTGMAAAFGGFMYDNQVMLTGGILVGAAGTLLTILMCNAMNRSLKNVLLGSFGGGATAASTSSSGGNYKEITLSDAAVVLSYANKVMIVPGYGLAVAQAQHICHELEKFLEDKGVDVRYAIHPVAGRMPGHMNVLLAEADVSYEKLLEMEHANDEFKTTDVVLVLGANDVVNPAAKTDPASPIYGMPILEVEQAKMVIVNKRSMKPGYAGIENELFFQPKTSMLFGDAKAALQKLMGEMKNL